MAVNIAGCGACNTLKALGDLSNCDFGRINAIGFQRLFDDAGDKIYFDTTSVTLGADILECVNMSVSDTTKRLFMTPKANVFNLTRSDENFATDQSNVNFALKTGEIVSVVAEFWEATDNLATRLRDWECKDTQVYFTSVDGKFLGSEVDEDHQKLCGWRIVPKSLTSRFVASTSEAPSKVMLSFQLEPTTEKNSNWAFLDKEQLGYNPTTSFVPAKHLLAVASTAIADEAIVVLRSPAKASNKYNYGRDLTTAAPANAVWRVYNETTNAYLSPNPTITFADVPDDQIIAGNEPEYTVDFSGALPSPPNTGNKLNVQVTVAGYLVQKSNTFTAL